MLHDNLFNGQQEVTDLTRSSSQGHMVQPRHSQHRRMTPPERCSIYRGHKGGTGPHSLGPGRGCKCHGGKEWTHYRRCLRDSSGPWGKPGDVPHRDNSKLKERERLKEITEEIHCQIGTRQAF